MILRRLILLGAIVGALTVSAIAVFSAAIFALHAVFAGWLGGPGGWALLFGLIASLLAAAAVLASVIARGKRRKPQDKADVPVIALADRIVEVVRERPLAAVSAAIGAGVLAVRDPGRLAMAIRRFAESADDRASA